MEKSNWLRDRVVEAALGLATFPTISTVYVALYLSNPTAADTGTEVSTGAYVRVAVSWAALVAGTGNTSNDAAVEFLAGVGGFGTVSHVGLRDAASGGNLLYFTPVTGGPQAIAEGQTVRFKAGELDVSET